MNGPGPIMSLDRIWPPFRKWIKSLFVAATAVGAFAFVQLAVRYAVPSDPCPSGDLECASSDSAWLTAGLITLGLSSALSLTAARLVHIQGRMLFVVPPGWPLPPPGWQPVEGWEPPATWPAPPVEWVFWRRHR